MGLPEFVDDIVTDYTRPTPSIDVSKSPMIKFVKESGCPNATKVNNTENARKPTVKYAEIPKIPTVGSKVPTAKPIVAADKGNKGKAVEASARWIWKPKQNSSSQGSNFNGVSGIPHDNIDDKGYYDSGCSRHMTGNISYLFEYDLFNGGYVSFGHGRGKITDKGSIKTDLAWMGLPEFVDDIVTNYTRPTPSIDVSKSVSKEQEERWKSNNPSFFEQGGSSGNVVSNPMIKFVKESGCPNATKVNNTKNDRKPTVKCAEIPKIPTVGSKVPAAKPTVAANKGNKRKAVKASTRWIWKPKQNSSGQGSNFNGVSVTFKKYQYIGTQGRLKYMTGNISYLSKYEPFNGGYVSFGHRRGKITGKGLIKTDFKLVDDKHVLLRTPRQQNMYTIDLKNVVPHKNLTCLIAKASLDESMLWHRRLGHLNFKTMNKLVRGNLVKRLPSKSFENDHSFIACLKGKQHKASCKSKLVTSVYKPLHTLHMDLFGPTSVSSLNHKWYCLVVTSAFSRIDNGGEFRNKEMDELCSRNRCKNSSADWAEVVNIAYYVQNRVLVIKPHNKTPYELFNERSLAIGFLRPFSKAFRVFNKRTNKIEENLHVDFLENKSIKKGIGPDWLFDIDTLTKSMNYVSVVVAGTSSTNILGTKEDAHQAVMENKSPLRFIALPNWFHEAQMETSNETVKTDDAIPNNNAPQKNQEEVNVDKEVHESSGNSNPTASTKVSTNDSFELASSSTVETEVPTVSTPVPTDSLSIPSVTLCDPRIISRGGSSFLEPLSLGNAMSFQNRWEDFFVDTSDAFSLNDGKSDLSNMETIIQVSPTPTLRIHKDHPKSQIIGHVDIPIQTRQKTKNPPSFQDLEFPHRVYKVDKAMYGLHQAPRAWYGTLSKYLLENGFQRGIREAKTPTDRENPWGKDGTGKDVELHLYRSMIRSLMYLTASRPDIMFAICACTRHQVTPKKCYLHAAKRIFRYLKGNPKLGLWYHKESPFDLVAYSDSDCGDDNQDRKSTTRGCQFLGRRWISWQCKKQTIMATSTTEAEYVAAVSGCGQVLWIQNQLLEYGYNFMNTKIYIDNNSAICIVKNLIYHSKTKHIEIRHHFIRDCYEKKLINVDHIHTDDNVADL
nr:putative ribonuclease H-like domain-containing protein [Tanacetum cinerariifolium]